MKKLITLLSLALIVGACFAQPTDVDIVYSGAIPQIVVWDDVTTDINDAPLIEGDSIRYDVFYSPSPFVPGQEVQLAADLVLAEATVDFSALARGYYYVGVRSVGETAGGDIERSDIAWSNDPVAVGPTSRFAYLVAGVLYPAVPTGLRTVGP